MDPIHYWTAIFFGGFLGLTFCFYGFRIFRVLCSLAWGATGLLMGMYLFPKSAILGLGTGGILACFGAYFGYRFYLLSVFLVGCLAGLSAGEVFINYQTSRTGLYALLALGLVVGLVAVWLQRPLIIASTSWKGAWILLLAGKMAYLGPGEYGARFGEAPGQGGWQGVWYLITHQEFNTLLLLFVIFLLGTFVQHKFTAHTPSEPEEEKKEKS